MLTIHSKTKEHLLAGYNQVLMYFVQCRQLPGFNFGLAFFAAFPYPYYSLSVFCMYHNFTAKMVVVIALATYFTDHCCIYDSHIHVSLGLTVAPLTSPQSSHTTTQANIDTLGESDYHA